MYTPWLLFGSIVPASCTADPASCSRRGLECTELLLGCAQHLPAAQGISNMYTHLLNRALS